MDHICTTTGTNFKIGSTQYDVANSENFPSNAKFTLIMSGRPCCYQYISPERNETLIKTALLFDFLKYHQSLKLKRK